MTSTIRDETYVRMFRKSLNDPLFLEKPFDRWHAFEYLIYVANRFPKDEIIKGQVVHIDTGQLIMSQRKMAEIFGWSINKVIRFKKLLEQLGKAKFDGDTYGDSIGTLITIEKYEKYQVDKIRDGDTNETTDENTRGNTNETTDGDNINKVKKVNKVKNNIYYGEFKNVSLSEEELEKLKEQFPYDWQNRIEKLSRYMKSRGKRYKNHYATILTWAQREEEDVKSEKNNGHEEPYRTSEKDYSANGSGFRT